MSRILGIGIATVDVVVDVDHYPLEDEELRASSQRVSRGGNATNTLTVLAQAGHPCSWAGTLADDAYAALITSDLDRYAVSHQYAKIVPNSKSPVSYVTCNLANGSRTIVHYRDLREFEFNDAHGIEWQEFDWIHFEGRAVNETLRLLKQIRALNNPPRVSLEAEKPRANIEQLFSFIDVLFCGKPYWQAAGFEDPRVGLAQLHRRYSQALISVTDGANGAGVVDSQGQLHWQAIKPVEAVDSLGAGDVFNAAMIHGLSQSKSVQHSLQQACALARRKCQQRGLHNLWDEAVNIV